MTRHRHHTPEVLYIVRRSTPTVPAPPPALDLSRAGTLCRRDLAAELGPGWSRSIILRPASVLIRSDHHGVPVGGAVELVADHVPAALAAIASARRGEVTRTALYLPDTLRHVRATTDADGLRLRVRAQQRLRIGPRPIPLDARELDALQAALVTLASIVRAA